MTTSTPPRTPATALPLVLRGREPIVAPGLTDVRYDEDLDMSVLPDGTPVALSTEPALRTTCTKSLEGIDQSESTSTVWGRTTITATLESVDQAEATAC